MRRKSSGWVRLGSAGESKAYDERVGVRLREARERAGLAQHEMAYEMGWSIVSLSNYEAGKTPITGSRLVAFAQFCSVAPSALLPDLEN
jgi:transcriptional regulator with XRE-family HTH domain